MSKDAKNPVAPTADTQPQAPAADGVRLTLDAFCARLSETVKRPELIGAFHHSENASGHLVGDAAEFQARYDSFINKPV